VRALQPPTAMHALTTKLNESPQATRRPEQLANYALFYTLCSRDSSVI